MAVRIKIKLVGIVIKNAGKGFWSFVNEKKKRKSLPAEYWL